MPIEYIEFNGKKYPKFQSEGNAARWIMPLAQYYCKGRGLDIGYSKEEWKLPGAFGVEPSIDSTFDAMDLPVMYNVGDSPEIILWDFIHSSHCLEHINSNWADVLDYWFTKLKDGGVLFLYLPHESQEYWNPENNRKHIHKFNGSEIKAYLEKCGYEPYVTPVDFNNSFAVVCYKEKVADEHERLCMAAELAQQILAADEKEKYCKERGVEHIREGNNVIYNEPSYIKYDKADSHDDLIMPGAFDKSIYKDGIPILESHKPLSYLPKLFKAPYHEYGRHKFKLVESTDGFIKNCAMVEVELHGETYKTGFLVYPVQWNDDIQSLYPVFDKMIMGVKMVTFNKA